MQCLSNQLSLQRGRPSQRALPQIAGRGMLPPTSPSPSLPSMALRERNEEPASLKIARLHRMDVTYLLVIHVR